MALQILVNRAECQLAASLRDAAVERLNETEGDDYLPSEVDDLLLLMKGGV